MTCKAIQLSEPAIVQVLSLFRACGERRGQQQGRDGAEPGSCRVLGVHTSPLNTLSPILLLVLTGHTQPQCLLGVQSVLIEEAATSIERSEFSIWS